MIDQKNIALWSHPRSMSTSVERYFRERGDCQCHHEPFMYYYYLEKKGKLYPGFDPEANRPSDLDAIAEMVTTQLASADDHKHIFFKDMSYYIIDHLIHLEEMMSNLISIFLIRDPRLSLSSYSKLDPNFTLEEGGLEAQWRHYHFLKEQGLNPIVIDADTIMADPAETMRLICGEANIPFIKDALTWQADETPSDWQQVKSWHAGSIQSTGFAPPQMIDPNEIFDNAARKMPILHDYLAHHQPYYQRLKMYEIK